MTKNPNRAPRAQGENRKSGKPQGGSQARRRGRGSGSRSSGRRGGGQKNKPHTHAEVTIKGSGRRDSSEVDRLAIVKYGHEDEQEQDLPVNLERYDIPDPNPAPDPYGDDLFALLPQSFTPVDTKKNARIWTLIRWGIPAKSSWFPGGKSMFKVGEQLLVETEKGTFIGTVLEPSMLKIEGRPSSPRRVLRRVNERDLERVERHEKLAKEAFSFARTRIRHYKLDMNLFTVHVLHNGDKILFYFTAENRIDFRQLVSELAAKFSMRIEMRQMGVRDDAKVLGGIGPCGRVLCCSGHLNRFMPVSIRMAKDQNLVLKPQNVSGQCGRLKCCLAYEQDFYRELRRDLPKNGKRIMTPQGQGRVLEVNILKEQVRVGFERGETAIYTKEELKAFKENPDALQTAPREPEESLDEQPVIDERVDSESSWTLSAEERSEAHAHNDAEGGADTRRRSRSRSNSRGPRPPREGNRSGGRAPREPREGGRSSGEGGRSSGEGRSSRGGNRRSRDNNRSGGERGEQPPREGGRPPRDSNRAPADGNRAPVDGNRAQADGNRAPQAGEGNRRNRSKRRSRRPRGQEGAQGGGRPPRRGGDKPSQGSGQRKGPSGDHPRGGTPSGPNPSGD